MKADKSKTIFLILILIIILVVLICILNKKQKTEAFEVPGCEDLLSRKYDGVNTIQSYISSPVPNNLSITQKYIGGTGGSVKADETIYKEKRAQMDRISRVLGFLRSNNTPCGNETFITILDKFAKEKSLSRFDMVQNQTAFVTIQQLSIVMSITANIKSRTLTDSRWPAIQRWFAETSQIYARYFNGEQLDISTFCSPTVFFQNRFMPVSEAIQKKAPFKTFNRLNNIQLSKLIMLAMSAVLNNDDIAMQRVVAETIDHIDRNKYEDDFKPRAERVVSNDNNGQGTYNFQCGFIASEANRRGLILHYNSYYMMFIWSLFLIFKSFSTPSKNYMEPFYKYKHDISLVVRNLTDPTSIKTTSTPQNAGILYINKYKNIYMSKIKYDLTKPPPENPSQPAMQTLSAEDAAEHLDYFMYFFGVMDRTISPTVCDNRGKAASSTIPNIEVPLPKISAEHLTNSEEVVNSITALRRNMP